MVTYKVNKVSLEPAASFRSRLLGIVEAASGVVADGRGIRGSVTLSSGLDPDDLTEARSNQLVSVRL